MAHIIITDTMPVVAECWAAAAGAAGAYAPPLIAAALIETDGDLLRAVILGTRRAWERHVSEGGDGPDPRGCEVQILNGDVHAIVWRSWTHTITLYRFAAAAGAQRWECMIETPGEPELSYRVQAAQAAQAAAPSA